MLIDEECKKFQSTYCFNLCTKLLAINPISVFFPTFYMDFFINSLVNLNLQGTSRKKLHLNKINMYLIILF